MRLRLVLSLLAIGVVLATAGAPVPHPGGAGAPAPSAVAPMAAIDLGEIFGNENEPDENEADEGSRGGQTTHSSGTSLPVVLVLMAVALMAGAYAALRVRRLWLRMLGWGRGMRARL